MFGIGFSELIVLSGIIFVVLGPKRIPGVLQMFAKVFREVSKVRTDLQSEMEKDETYREIRKSVDEVKESVQQEVDKLRPDQLFDVKKSEEEAKAPEKESSGV